MLVAAWSLMGEDPARASMAKIAAAAGVSRQAAYLHFENRAGLLLALVRWIDDREDVFGKLSSAAADKPPVEALRAYVLVWLGYLRRLHPVPGYLARARHDPPARAAWDDRMVAMETLYKGPVTALHREGGLRDGLSVRRAIDLIRAIASVHALEHLVDDQGWSVKAASEALWRAVEAAVLD